MAVRPAPAPPRTPESARSLPLPAEDATRNRIIAGLPDIERQLILKHVTPVRFQFNQVLYEAGEKIDHMYFPLDSVISALTILRDGATVETYMTGKEGLVGLLGVIGGGEALFWLSVAVPGRALKVSTRILTEGFRRNDAIQEALMRWSRFHLKQISQRAVCNARHTLIHRLSSWLLMLHDRAGVNDLHLTQEAMAGKLGARRAGVSLAANFLQRVGGIEYQHGRLLVRDRAPIERMACECYDILRLRPALVSAPAALRAAVLNP
jgi:CRP-like cAMP-binding protein